MSNHGGGRAFRESRTRYCPPPPQKHSVDKYNLSLPPHSPKAVFPRNKPFDPGSDLRSIFRRFDFESPEAPSIVPVVAPTPAPPSTKTDTKPEAQEAKSTLETAPVDLPILKYRDQIVAAVLSSPVTIIKGQTGSGKSTMVPEFLHAAGLRVHTLVPRRLLASELAERGATAGSQEPEKYGYRHGLASNASSKTEILTTTVGHKFAKELHHATPGSDVLILDEFHELLAEAEVFLALLKKRELAGLPIPKIVIMSATLNSPEVARYFGTTPVIEIEGRQWPITELPKGPTPELDAVRLAEDGRNVAVFVYGKSEINELAETIHRIGTDAKVFPLHSQLPHEEQKKAIDPSIGKKIVLTTNIFGTGLTDPSIDAVITTPYVRRLTCSDEGVRSLIIDTIVQDELDQYAGRGGRAKPGVHINHAPPRERLQPHAPPEIQNIPLDSIVLKVAAARESFRELNKYLIHPAPEAAITQAYETLFHLELLGPEGHILPLGKRVARLGISPRWGKLVAKAADFQREHEVDIVSQAIDIAAVCEAEGILSGDSSAWRRFTSTDKSSDLLLQLKIFRKALLLPSEQREALGIDEVNLLRARDIQRKLVESVRRDMSAFDGPSHTTRTLASFNQEIVAKESQAERERTFLSLALLLSHLDSVFYCAGNDRGYYNYNPISFDVGGKRTKLYGQAILSKSSTVGGSAVVVGTRFNLGVMGEWGEHRILPFLLLAHPVEEAELAYLQSSSSSIRIKAYNQIKGHLGQRVPRRRSEDAPKFRENPSKQGQRRRRR